MWFYQKKGIPLVSNGVIISEKQKKMNSKRQLASPALGTLCTVLSVSLKRSFALPVASFQSSSSSRHLLKGCSHGLHWFAPCLRPVLCTHLPFLPHLPVQAGAIASIVPFAGKFYPTLLLWTLSWAISCLTGADLVFSSVLTELPLDLTMNFLDTDYVLFISKSPESRTCPGKKSWKFNHRHSMQF